MTAVTTFHDNQDRFFRKVVTANPAALTLQIFPYLVKNQNQLKKLFFSC